MTETPLFQTLFRPSVPEAFPLGPRRLPTSLAGLHPGSSRAPQLDRQGRRPHFLLYCRCFWLLLTRPVPPPPAQQTSQPKHHEGCRGCRNEQRSPLPNDRSTQQMLSLPRPGFQIKAIISAFLIKSTPLHQILTIHNETI